MEVVRDASKDVVKAGAFRVTLGTQLASVITAVVPAIGAIGAGELRGPQAAIIVAAISAFAVVTAADVLARSWATCCARAEISLVPRGFGVKNTPRPESEESGWTAVALRASAEDPSTTEFLLVKRGQKPEWVDATAIQIS